MGPVLRRPELIPVPGHAGNVEMGRQSPLAPGAVTACSCDHGFGPANTCGRICYMEVRRVIALTRYLTRFAAGAQASVAAVMCQLCSAEYEIDRQMI